MTAVDPVAAIAEIARRYGLWLHVDAAMAGSAMILPECRAMWAGIEGADSLVFNPHKWLGAAFDCSLYYVRDPQHLMRVMGTNPSYLRDRVDGEVTTYRDWGVPLGRRFRALKLWCLLRAEGVEALRARLRRDLDNARWLAAEAERAPGWRVVAPVNLQTVCLRHEPEGLEGEALDRHTLDWADRLNRSGRAYVTPAIARRALDGARLDRRAGDGARRRRGVLGAARKPPSLVLDDDRRRESSAAPWPRGPRTSPAGRPRNRARTSPRCSAAPPSDTSKMRAA